MAIGADQGHISVRQHNRAQRAAAVVTRVRQSAGTIITAQRKINMRRLILPDHEAMTALVDNLVESIGKRTPT
jgi:predicted nucleic acid-binding Zn ribbon protein